MTERSSRALSTSAPALALALYAVVTLFTIALIPPALASGAVLSDPVLVSPLMLSLEIVIAALILRRYPRHPVGWLFAAHAIGMTTFAATIMFVVVAVASPGTLPGADAVYWYARWAWWPFWLLLFVPLLFPDGRVPSRRWAYVLGLDVLVIVTLIASEAFAPLARTMSGRVLPPNPLVADPAVIAVLSGAAGLGIPIAAMFSVAALITRYRRGDRTVRSQLKWVVFGFGAVILLLGAIGVVGPALLPRALVVAALPITILLVPASVGIAILRYRLYDIDVLIRRTVVYALVSAMLAGTYVAGVVLMGAALRPFIAASDLAVAVSTLIVVALFQPIRARVQGLVDRRFYRSRYDAVRTVDAFAARLRDKVELDAIRADLLGAVGDTVRPAHASVWLRSDR